MSVSARLQGGAGRNGTGKSLKRGKERVGPSGFSYSPSNHRHSESCFKIVSKDGLASFDSLSSTTCLASGAA